MGRRFRHDYSLPQEDELRINHRIRFHEVRVIDENGEQLGIMHPDEGRRIAGERGFDLVEVAPQSRPPVCRIMDYGKYKYERSKKQTQSASPEIKTIQFRPKTGDHDLETKLSNARKFLERGDKVRFVMRMRGREHAYPERWVALMKQHFEESLGEIAHISTPPSHQGRTISMLVEPS
ncbi:MAG: translation initiation factor IF-3 [Deltaproteobacteria bacterium]|nr:MAG: translation initiation factor IF-3 [Deltaproteobacteria bacterium]